MNIKEVMQKIREEQVVFIDLKVVDLVGVWKHVTLPVGAFNESIFEFGIGFDASNFGYATVEKSDMVMIPDPTTAFIDPFAEYVTLSMICDVYDVHSGERFNQDARGILSRVVEFVEKEGIADEIMFGPEYEFHVFDDVSYEISSNSISLNLDSCEGFWNSGETGEYYVGKKRGYHRTPPFDKLFNFRNEVVERLESMDIPVKYHHHEVGTAQLEIETRFMNALKAADATLLTKYVIRNVGLEYGFVVSFMPKPMYDEAGNGMHVHQFMNKNGQNIFAGNVLYGLSQTALNYTGGILKHSSSLLGLTNPTTNSYRRLVPGFEAPVNAVFAMGNRTSAIRIPGYVKDEAKKRIEFRTIDASCNPYLAFAAMILAGVDGIINEIDPRKEGYGPMEGDISKSGVNPLPKNLEEAVLNLKKDNEYLKRWNAFPQELIDKWVDKKLEEHIKVTSITHPVEYQLYFDI